MSWDPPDGDELAASANGATGERLRGPGEHISAARPKLRKLDVERMLTTEPEPVPWIAEPLLVRGAVTMLAGREGQGKSMLALALGAAIGHGAGVAGIACEAGRVLVVDAENGEREAHRRVRGLGVKRGTLAYVEAEGFNLGGDLGELAPMLAEQTPDLLVLDSFRSLAPGMDENDSGAVEAVLGPLRSLARRHGCAVLLLAHAGKAGYEYRGSTAIGAAVELGFTMSRDPADPDGRSRRKVSCWKCRVAPEPDTRWIALEARAGRVFVGEAEPFAGAEHPPSQEEALAERFAGHVAERGPLQWAQLCAAAGVPSDHGTAKRARARAIGQGWLVKLEHGVYGPPGHAGPMAGPMDEQPSDQATPLGPMDGRTVAEPPDELGRQPVQRPDWMPPRTSERLA